ncbi:hypothetical protein LJR168_003828 [Pseudoxanthomonas sp. LjRoot168]|uniref:hypothetical protein n=1 Tax=unclassified Pseudoxanthomonas TaxID=2645906 RepID=UPI003ECF8D62
MSSIKKVARKGSKRVSALMTGLILIAISASASAEGLPAILKRLTGLGQDSVNLIQMGGVVLGMALVVGGLFGFYSDAKKEGNGPINKKVATIMVLVGCTLTALSSVLTTGSDTVWGDGKADRGKITVPQ